MPQQTPIYTTLKKYMEENNLRLHMPGHIGNMDLGALELEAIACLDLTEVPGLDDLHAARGILEEARQLLAQACGSVESFFLVNGATSGIHALFMSLGEGNKVMIPRNAHRSFYGAMVLSDAMPVYIPCEMEPELGIPLVVSAEKVEDLLYLHKDVEAVFITSPSYYGTCCDIAGISNAVKRWGKMLLADEAHGAHFPFHPSYPAPALKDGAVAVVNGLHKTWPALTQGACLHLGEGFVKRDRLLKAYSMLTTTSPSYPLMASIDLARAFMEQKGHSNLERALELSQEFKPRLNMIPGIRCYGEELLKIPGLKAIDPLKVLIGVQGLCLTGYQVSCLLREKYHIQVEMEEQNLILAMFSLLHTKRDWEQLYLALGDLASCYQAKPGSDKLQIDHPPTPRVIRSPRQAFFSSPSRVKLEDSRGRVAGEMIAAYPPGIPCLVPGELITEEIENYLYYLKKIGARVHGPEEPSLEYIKVIE